MRVIPRLLAKFASELKTIKITQLAEQLTGLGFEAEHIDEKSGTIDVSVTPNRADGMSHLGLARDLCAGLSARDGKPRPVIQLESAEALRKIPASDIQPIRIEDNVATQYHVVILENVTIQPSPKWLQDDLRALGLHPINNVVDLTNYLMELYGQPLHAFDADSIKGEMIVRASKTGETLTTIDGTVHTLPESIPVIQDDSGLIDLAGIRGGKTSEIRPKTKRVLIQSAIFDRSKVRKAVNDLQYRTTASTRYERGVDPFISLPVLEQAVQYLESEDFGSARAVGKFLPKMGEHDCPVIHVDAQKISRLLGFDVSKERLIELMQALDIQVLDKDPLAVAGPSWRFDLNIWQDVAEEVARLEGLNDTIPSIPLPPAERSAIRSQLEWAEALKDRLTNIGLSEVQTYSFISKADMERFDLTAAGELANPLNPQLAFLRPSLMPCMANVIAINGLIDPIHTFEIGHVFTGDSESVNLVIGLASNRVKIEQWVESLAKTLEVESSKLSDILSVREIDSTLKDAYKIRKQQVILLEVPLQKLQDITSFDATYRIPTEIARYRPLSKFPPVTRDLAIIVDADIDANTIHRALTDSDTAIESVDLFDEFASDKFGEGKKSLAFHLYYSTPDHTLTHEEADSLHAKVQIVVQNHFNATVR